MRKKMFALFFDRASAKRHSYSSTERAQRASGEECCRFSTRPPAAASLEQYRGAQGARSNNNRRSFTLLELLIVISIIAILAATIVPNFIGFDTEARISATMTNLNTLRARVSLYRAKEGEYPASLGDLQAKTYDDMGVQQPYLEKIPQEMLSAKGGNNTSVDISAGDELPNTGGWAYIKDKAKVIVAITDPLDNKWGKSKGQVPAEW